jgi:transposase, IS5 family
MAFKEFSRNLGFADIEVERVLARTRTQGFLEEINRSVDWEPIEKLLMRGYPVGDSELGNKAFYPIVLLKAVLLQKWYGIDSDPELENQINDRLSFKKFIGIPLGQFSPDHSLISKFRKRVSQQVMEAIHSELLKQFSEKEYSIEGGMAIDARLVKSSARPRSKEKIEEEREKRETAEGQMDKKGKPLKFRSDLESDWVVRNEKPFYGMKENASIDVDSGLVLSTWVSKASEHDTNFFEAVAVKGMHGKKNPPKIYADKGYCGQDNRRFLSRNKIRDGIMRKEQKNANLTELEHERNKKISKIRYKIEQYFGLTERHMGGGRARFTTLIKENWNRLSMVIAFNTKRVLFAERKKIQEAMA